jgi:hypothetical protein
MIENNFLPTTDNFTVHIGDRGSKSVLNRSIVSFSLPAITNNEISTPYLNSPGFSISETTSKEPLQISFICDEDMSAYEEVYNWMNDNNNPNKDSNNQNAALLDFKDIIINIKSSHNNLNKQLHFKEAFPTSLSSVDFNIQAEGDPVYAIFQVSFRYDTFEFRK